jgi:hypothetical protein
VKPGKPSDADGANLANLANDARVTVTRDRCGMRSVEMLEAEITRDMMAVGLLLQFGPEATVDNRPDLAPSAFRVFISSPKFTHSIWRRASIFRE